MIVLFKPGNGPVNSSPNRSSEIPSMPEGRAALDSLMDLCLRGMLDSFLTLLEVRKFMYVIEKVGEPLRLTFKKGTYGPCSKNRWRVTQIRARGRKRCPRQAIVSGSVEDATALLDRPPDTKKRPEKVTQAVDGFESTFGLELLSTAHRVASENPSVSGDEVIAHTYTWGARKRHNLSNARKGWSRRCSMIMVGAKRHRRWAH